MECLHRATNLATDRFGHIRDKSVLYARLTKNACLRNAFFDENAEGVDVAAFNALAEEEALLPEEAYAELFEEGVDLEDFGEDF